LKKSFYLISFILLALCFLPALCLPFAHHDNARFFDKFYTPHSTDPDKRDPQYSIIYLLGRPLTGEIQQIIYTQISNIEDLKIVRWLTVSVFAICAGLFANILYSLGLSTLESLGLSVAIFILPGVQDAVIMLAIQNALAILTVLWAYLVSCRPHRSGLGDLFDALMIFCLILTSMLFYPQWSFFIFIPVLVKYLISPFPDLRSIYKELLRLTFFFIITAIFYYFFVKTFVSFNSARAGSYAFTIDLNFLYWKVLSVFSKILPMAFNFWNIHTNTWLGLALMGLTLVLLKRRAILCLLMILWTVSFWLLARTDVVLHRIFFVASVMALTAFLIGLRNSFHKDGIIAKYIIILGVTAGLLGVHYLTFYNALNYYLEFTFIKQRLIAHHEPFSRIHIVLAEPNGKGYNGHTTVDDTFNARTASYNFSTDTLNLLKAALKDINVPTSWWVYSCEDEQQKCIKHMPSGYRLLVTHSKKGQPVYYSPGMVLIDLNNL
jgi:hypothetical protein